MIAHSEPCDPQRLDQFLRNQLPEELRPRLEAHLLVCPACQAKLDELAGGDPWWSDVRRFLGEDRGSQPSRLSATATGRDTVPGELGFLTPSTDPASIGRLGPYEVRECLGRGGMGIVLKAFDPALHRPVAIKVLAAELAARGAARKRFVREAQAAAAVSHEHVVAVHAVNADATPPYLVMAYIPGQSLQERLDHAGPLELKEILRIGMQAAAGLAAAHAQGLVHRDIKPANLMLENGIERVRITDFGLARAVDDASLTQRGVVAGTPSYMAPEQANGEAVDQRADLFALGSTLYAMATGRPPFRGDGGLAVLRQVCDVEPVALRTINPDLPVWFEGIVRKLHAKDPAQRFQSADVVATLLERCLAHVQQPPQHPLPALATELGRQVPGATPRQATRYWRPAVTLLVASVVCGATLILLPGPTARQGATPPEAGTHARPEADADLLAQNELSSTSQRMRTQLDGMRRSFSFAASEEPAAWDLAWESVRQRADKLQRAALAPAELALDPVEEQLQTIRHRLQQLQREVNGQPE